VGRRPVKALTVFAVSLGFPCLVRASAHSRSFYHVTLTAGTRPANHATARTCDPRGPALARFGLFSFWERVAAHLQSWLARAGYLFLEMMSRSFLSLKTCGHFVAGFGSFCCRFWFSEVVRRLRPVTVVARDAGAWRVGSRFWLVFPQPQAKSGAVAFSSARGSVLLASASFPEPVTELTSLETGLDKSDDQQLLKEVPSAGPLSARFTGVLRLETAPLFK
jgi:hypothetical protein